MKNGVNVRTGRHGALRGESPAFLTGVAVAAILMASMAAATWWALRTQTQSMERVRVDELNATAELLVQSAESMLAANETTAVRRLLIDVARKHRLSSCRVLLPDGQVLADADPGKIDVAELPPRWQSTAELPKTTATEPRHVALSLPMVVPGRGSARLEIAGSSLPTDPAPRMTEAGIGGITVTALVALLLLYRWSRSRLRGMEGVIRALLAYSEGGAPTSELSVSPDWGPEACAWNRFVGAFEDLLKRASMERTRETLQARQGQSGDLDAACDALSQGLVLVGRDMKARYVNGAAAVMLQFKREEAMHRPVQEFIRDGSVLEAVRRIVADPSQGRAIVETPADQCGADGVLRFVVRPVRREDAGNVMIVVEDITQQRAAEAARTGFVTQATHELRTPLTNIRLYAETALDEGEKDPALRAECLNIINREAQRLGRMVEDILSVAEVEAGVMKIKRDDVRLMDLLTALASDYDAQAKDKQIDLRFDLPTKLPVMQGDRSKIALGMHNLVSNALKYTQPGGKVHVNVNVEQGRMVMEVNDTGIGIGEEDCKRVFEKFYRAHDKRVTAATGSGLGLAIARDVVRLHGGDITVQSELNKGSTFTLCLPLGEKAA